MTGNRAERRHPERFRPPAEMLRSATASPTLSIGYVHPGTVDARFVRSLVNLVDHQQTSSRLIGRILDTESGPLVWIGRNQIVRDWLAGPSEWLLMLDADMVFGADLADRLLDAADPDTRPIVTGLAFGGRDGEEVFPLVALDDKQLPDRTIAMGTVIEVDKCAAGCLLIHRTVAEGMRHVYEPDTDQPWFSPIQLGRDLYGEDYGFCLRARAAGYPIFCDTGTLVGHRKLRTIGHEDIIRDCAIPA